MRKWTVDRPGPFAKHVFGERSDRRVIILKSAAVGKTAEMVSLLTGPRLGAAP